MYLLKGPPLKTVALGIKFPTHELWYTQVKEKNLESTDFHPPMVRETSVSFTPGIQKF
jgi:hypothetical protein